MVGSPEGLLLLSCLLVLPSREGCRQSIHCQDRGHGGLVSGVQGAGVEVAGDTRGDMEVTDDNGGRVRQVGSGTRILIK